SVIIVSSTGFFPSARCAIRAANHPCQPRNPCPVCFAAVFRVARGRIIGDPLGLGKRFLEFLQNGL
ncbi:hypothetical protein, partial [Cupriavidus basilensis]|uniref:hypothetical protein n=1 Tax=Cupriavidus basilensis TaxID=68895 RepID=UPI00283C995A